nr:reverse transcriptase domain-containing protein [Tanacetum cinerariifolium]
MSRYSKHEAKMAEINKNLMKVLQINQQVKAVTQSCETCGGPHSYNDCPATVGQTQNVYAAEAYNQGGNSYQPQGNRNLLSYRSKNYIGPPRFNQNQNRSNPNQKYQNQNKNQGNNHGHVQGNNQGRNQFFQGSSHGQHPPLAYQAPAYQAPIHQAPISQPQVDTFAQRSESSSSINSSFDPKIVALKAEMVEINKNLMKVLQINQQVKAITLSCESCGGPRSYNDCPATVGQTQNVYAARAYNQGGNSYNLKETVICSAIVRTIISDHQGLIRIKTEAIQIKTTKIRIKETIMEMFRGTTKEETNSSKELVMMNSALSSGSRTLPSNTINNPKENLKGITIRSGIAYKGPTIPTTFSPPKVVKRKTEVTKDTTRRALIDVYEGELTLRVGNKAVTFNLDQTSRYSANYDAESINRIDVIDVACEEYSQEVLGFSVSGNPTPSTEPIVPTSSFTLTPFRDSDFLLEETDAFLAIKDEPSSPEIDDSYYDSEGDILFLE